MDNTWTCLVCRMFLWLPHINLNLLEESSKSLLEFLRKLSGTKYRHTQRERAGELCTRNLIEHNQRVQTLSRWDSPSQLFLSSVINLHSLSSIIHLHSLSSIIPPFLSPSFVFAGLVLCCLCRDQHDTEGRLSSPPNHDSHRTNCHGSPDQHSGLSLVRSTRPGPSLVPRPLYLLSVCRLNCRPPPVSVWARDDIWNIPIFVKFTIF